MNRGHNPYPRKAWLEEPGAVASYTDHHFLSPCRQEGRITHVMADAQTHNDKNRTVQGRIGFASVFRFCPCLREPTLSLLASAHAELS